MADTQQSQKHVLVPIGNGTEEIEAVTIIDTLRRSNTLVTVASVESNNNKIIQCSRGVVLYADVSINEVANNTYDAVVLPGGAAGAQSLYNNPILHQLLQSQLNSNKLVGAICAAPAVVLSGHKLLHNINNVVCHPSFASQLHVTHSSSHPTTGHLMNGNTVQCGDRVAVDKNIITSQGVGTALEFALVVVDKLYNNAQLTQSVATPMCTNFIGSSKSIREQLKLQSTLSDVQGIFYDAYGTIFDVYSVSKSLDKYYPGKGVSISEGWRIKQLDYSWIRTLADSYVPFNIITTDALVTAVKQANENITEDITNSLISEYQTLPCYDDAPDNILRIRDELNIHTALFSNGPITSQRTITAANKLESHFQSYISADTIRQYKPSPHTYLHAHTAVKLQSNQCVLISSNTWDICGANNYGFHTIWINRKGVAFDELGTTPDHTVTNMNELYQLLAKYKTQGK